jgi:hypothetical protein
MLPDLDADCGFDLELATGLEAEGDLIADGTRDPAVFGHPRDSGEAEARYTAHHLEDCRDDVDASYRSEVLGVFVGHETPLGIRSSHSRLSSNAKAGLGQIIGSIIARQSPRIEHAAHRHSRGALVSLLA